jgi:ubiquitin-conjugating enzyme E2 O
MRPHDDPTRLNDIPDAVVENVTLYDIRAADGLNKRRGDFVILHPPVGGADINLSGQDIDWFGEVIDLGKDGFLTVRLGALKNVRDIRISPEFATIVHSSDMPNEFDTGEYDSDSDDEYETEYEGSDDGPWITPNGEPISNEDEGVWSTEDEDASEDEGAIIDLLANPDTIMTDAVDVHDEGPAGLQENSNSPSLPHAAAEKSAAPDVQLKQSPVHAPTLEGPLSNFAILDTSPPDSNPYLTSTPPALTSQRMKRVHREHNILASSLPEGIFVRTWESRLDLLRVLIIGPLDTPYEFAPFLIDIRIPPEYPQSPPEAYFHSWTEGKGPVNPNLYENGKICLSLLGTWHADEKGENWSPARSTILQILVSIMGLVLVKEPYFNEAGFEVRAGMADAKIPSQLYSERTYFRTRAFIAHACKNQVHGFEDLIRWLYLDRGDQAPKLLDKAIGASLELIDATTLGDGSAGSRGGLTTISKGAVVMLRREMVVLEELRFLNS